MWKNHLGIITKSLEWVVKVEGNRWFTTFNTSDGAQLTGSEVHKK